MAPTDLDKTKLNSYVLLPLPCLYYFDGYELDQFFQIQAKITPWRNGRHHE